jgi:Flp pilus assembly pilin Flp
MLARIKRWLRPASNRRGQSLIEYTLLLGFIALASCVLVVEVGDGVLGAAEKGDEVLATANATAPESPTTTSSTDTGGTSGGGRQHHRRSHHRWHW